MKNEFENRMKTQQFPFPELEMFSLSAFRMGKGVPGILGDGEWEVRWRQTLQRLHLWNV